MLGTLNLLEGCRRHGVGRLVSASSSAAVGLSCPPITEEAVPHPVSPYGASKLAGEAYCSAYAQSFGIDTVCLRFGNVYGPGSSHKESVVARFIRRALSGQPMEVFGDGSQTRDFIFIDDIVSAILASVAAPGVAGEVFQIASAAETTVAEIAAMLRGLLAEYGVATDIVEGPKRTGDVMRSYSCTDKAANMLGWHPKTDLSDGLRLTVQWFLENGRSRSP